VDIGKNWTNGDAVEDFIASRKGRWDVGDKFVLPDIEQAYTVIAVRPFMHRGKFRLFVDLEAECAVEGCGAYLMTTKEVHQWRASRYLVRCCESHTKQFSTPMENAWKTQAEIAEARARVSGAEKPKPVATRKMKIGVWENAVLAAFYRVGGAAADAELVRQASKSFLPVTAPYRDVRTQNLWRAVRSLRAKGMLVTEAYGDLM
jgi:hypothetical protein